MYPHLVENQIRSVLHYNLHECHKMKTNVMSMMFNIFCLLFITGIVGSILYYKYKGQQDLKEKQRNESKKRDYILYNLRKFQNIKNKYLTNISFE